MPNTTWANQILCTVADVRQRLTSPEIPLYLTKADDSPIGITVSGTTVTTTIPHNLSTSNIVNFSSSLTLPSPLVANTDYYVIPTGLTPTTFSVSTVFGGSAITFTSPGTGQISVRNVTVDSAIQSKINLSKDWIRQDITLDLKQRIPELIDSWLSYKRFQINRSMQNIRRDIQQISDAAGLPTVGIIGFDGTIFDLFFFLTQFPQIHPRTYSNYGTPTDGVNGTMSGSAFTGDILIDTFNWVLYLNKGTLTSPVWKSEFTAQDAMNNLINVGQNPAVGYYNELVHVAVNATIWAMAQDGMLRNRASFEDDEFRKNTTLWAEKMYKSSLKAAIPLLAVDIDGDGKLSDYERGLVTDEIPGIG